MNTPISNASPYSPNASARTERGESVSIRTPRERDEASDQFEQALRERQSRGSIVEREPREESNEADGTQTPPPAPFAPLPRFESNARSTNSESDEPSPSVEGASSCDRSAPAISLPIDAPRPTVGLVTEQMTPGLRAAFESNWSAFAAGVQTLQGPGQVAGQWEVTIDEPLGVPVELRATRADGAQRADGLAGWQLTVTTHTLDGSTLTRHAPRLDGRLRERGIAAAHLRIEDRSEGEAT